MPRSASGRQPGQHRRSSGRRWRLFHDDLPVITAGVLFNGNISTGSHHHQLQRQHRHLDQSSSSYTGHITTSDSSGRILLHAVVNPPACLFIVLSSCHHSSSPAARRLSSIWGCSNKTGSDGIGLGIRIRCHHHHRRRASRIVHRAPIESISNRKQSTKSAKPLSTKSTVTRGHRNRFK